MATNKSKVILSVLFSLGLSLAPTFVMTGCSGAAPVSLSIQPTNVVLDATKTQQFTVNVHNTSNKRVTWKFTGCAAAACGTISTDGLYTAPSIVPDPAVLSITATSQADSTKSASANLNLLPLSVIIPEDSVTLCAGEEHQFSASVMRHPNTAVTWNLSGCTISDCGSIDTGGHYVSPASVPSRSSVTVTARSQADPMKYDSATVYNIPVEVSVTPPGTILTGGATITFRASVKQDIMNAGVTWALEPGCSPETCGTLTNYTKTSVTYTAPEAVPDPSSVTLVATSVTDTDKSSEVIITISDTLTLLEEGDYAFYFNGDAEYKEEGYSVWAAGAGRFHCDGYGNITDGVQDLNLPSGVSQSVPFTGTYTVSPDYRGNFEINTSEGTSSYFMTVNFSGTGGKFISFDDSSKYSSIAVSGYFELQDKSAFSLSAVAGPYVIGISSGDREMAAVGRLEIDGTGNISVGRMDVTEFVYSDDGRWYIPTATQNLSLTGFISEPSASTGRGTAMVALTPTPPGGADIFNFAYYIASDQKILLVQVDNRASGAPIQSGEMRRQMGPFFISSFDAPSIFNLSGISLIIPGLTIGRIVPDGTGSVTGVIDLFDYLEDTFPPIRNEEFWGSYSIESDGRCEIALEMNLDFNDYNRYPSSSIDHEAFFRRNSNQTYVAYFFGQNQGFLIQTSGNRGSYPLFGGFKPQAVGPFSTESISETFLTGTMPGLSLSCNERISGLTTFDVEGNITSSMEINQCSNTSHREFSGQYTVTGNGRGTIMFDGREDYETVFWIISPSELAAISGNYWDWERVLIEFRR